MAVNIAELIPYGVEALREAHPGEVQGAPLLGAAVRAGGMGYSGLHDSGSGPVAGAHVGEQT